MPPEDSCLLVIAHCNVIRLYRHNHFDSFRLNHIAMCIYQRPICMKRSTWYQGSHVTGKHPVQEMKPVLLVHTGFDAVYGVLRYHNVNALGFNIQPHLRTEFCLSCRLYHNFIFSGLHCNLIMDTLKYDRGHNSPDNSFIRCCNHHVLRSHHCINHCPMLNVIHTFKLCPAETYPAFSGHNAAKNIAVPNKIGYKGIFRLIINVFRRSYLLDLSL